MVLDIFLIFWVFVLHGSQFHGYWSLLLLRITLKLLSGVLLATLRMEPLFLLLALLAKEPLLILMTVILRVFGTLIQAESKNHDILQWRISRL